VLNRHFMEVRTRHAIYSGVESALYGSAHSARDLFRKNSFGTLDMISDTNGDGRSDIYTVKITAPIGSTCQTSVWSTEATQLLIAQGLDNNLYNSRMYILPSNVPCSWNGLAVGSNLTYVRSAMPDYIPLAMTHELGHTFGLGHGSTDWGDDGTVDSEYGDSSCPMGNTGPEIRMLNAPHAFRLAFYNSYSGRVREIAANETLDLAPLEESPSTSSTAQIARVYRPGTNDYYYLSIRSANSYDANISGFSSGVSVHRASDSPYQSRLVTIIAAGSSFSDPGSGIKVSVLSVSGGKATISVEVAGTECVPRAPTLSVAGPSTQLINSSGAAQFELSLMNNDNLLCPSTSFSINANLPAGISAATVAPLTLAPGRNVRIPISLGATSSVEAAYNLSFSAVDSGVVVHSASASLVAVLDRTAPTVPTALAGISGRKGMVTLSWSASSDSLSGVSRYEVYRDTGTGLVLLTTSSSTTAYDYSGSTSASYAVRAIDLAGNISELSAAVNVARKGGGKR
jgi:hypothetical protein